jgi:hypothetical protein
MAVVLVISITFHWTCLLHHNTIAIDLSIGIPLDSVGANSPVITVIYLFDRYFCGFSNMII